MRVLVFILLFINIANAQPMRFFQGAMAQYAPIVRNGLIVDLEPNNSTSFNNVGSTWIDISGNSNNFTLFNSPTFSTTNGYFTLNGTNQYSNNSSLSLSTYDLTISLWFKTSTTNLSILIEATANYNTSGNGFLAYIDNTGKIFISDVYTTDYNAVSTSSTYNNGVWHNLTCIFNRSLNSAAHNFIYVDGTLDNVQLGLPLNNFNFSRFISQPIYNSSRGGGSFFFNGSIGDILLYNRALTTTEILQNYNALKTIYK